MHAPSSEKHSPATRCLAGAKVRRASRTSLAQKKPLEKLAGTAKSNPSRPGSDLAICAKRKQPNALTRGARRTVHFSSPTACSSVMRSSRARTTGGSTTGAWPRGSCRPGRDWHHLWRSGSPPTLQERPQFQPGVHYTVNGGLLRVLNLLLGNPSTGLLPLCLERVREDAGRLVGAHAQKHGHQAVDPFLHGLADVLVHVDCPGFPLVDNLADRAQDH